MAKTPNYKFERKERDRIKAEKKALRAAEKQTARNIQPDSLDPPKEDDVETPT